MLSWLYKCSIAAVVLSFCTVSIAVADENTRDEAPSLSQLTGLDKLGIDSSVWAWGFYSFSDQDYYKTAWGAELEFDFTKTFANRISLSTDLEFIDNDDLEYGNIEQLFSSVLLGPDTGLLLTVGKFNSPIGAEGHDFWDRYTATPSLLFLAQPQDLRGVMLTAPIPDANLKIRGFVVTGFADEGTLPGRPSWGAMAEYKPNNQLTLAATGWTGPGLVLSHYHGFGYGNTEQDQQVQQYENYTLPNAWWRPEYEDARKGVLYFFDVHATYKPRPDLTLIAEFLYGTMNVDYSANYWMGAMAMANFDVDDHLRTYGMWSWIDDSDWVIWPELQRRSEVSFGFSYHIDKYWEVRAEYRHDFSDAIDDMDSFSMHISFGY